MTPRKYKKGKMIRTVAEFSKSGSTFYIVRFGFQEMTKHRAFLISWQYRTLERFINDGNVYEAELIARGEEHGNGTADRETN